VYFYSEYTSNAKLKSRNVLNSAVLTTSVFPKPPEEVFENEPVTILFKHVHPPKPEYLAEKNNPNSTSMNTTSQISSPAEEQHNEENVFCVYWQEGTE